MKAKKTKRSASKSPLKPAILTLAIAQALAAQAATIEVTSHLDDDTGCTLREAVESVNVGSNQGGCTSVGTFGSNDTVSFAPSVSGNTITLENSIRINQDISINPDGDAITVDGDFSSRIFTMYASAKINRMNIINGRAEAFAGAVRVSSSGINQTTLHLSNSTITNSAAIFYQTYGLPYLRAAGGAIESLDSTIIIENSTISGNSAGSTGGGISAYKSTIVVSNSTFSDNYNGGIVVQNSSISFANSIIDSCYGGSSNTVTTNGSNIIQTDGCFASAMSSNPGLLPLADNGGGTLTHGLITGSPAIDAGDNGSCEANDQRGVARDDGACDIGAYEFEEMVIPIHKKDRHLWGVAPAAEQWYSFNSTENQKLSIQTNGFIGDTALDLYTGTDPLSAISLASDDNNGPNFFSNIKHNIGSGPHLIRIKGKTVVNPYFLRLMSDRDILSFSDTSTHFANKEIRVMSSAGITGGCGTGIYCPSSPVTRAQMAIFMLKGILGGNHTSPAATGTKFSDVSTSSFGASFIEEFSTLGITSGCGGGKYCPDLAVTREQMAVFLLRAWYGSSYTPPTATPAEINQFSDIANSFARDWIVQLTKENITGGCGGGKYCPTDTVTRGQMAAFITRTFSLDTEL